MLNIAASIHIIMGFLIDPLLDKVRPVATAARAVQPAMPPAEVVSEAPTVGPVEKVREPEVESKPETPQTVVVPKPAETPAATPPDPPRCQKLKHHQRPVRMVIFQLDMLIQLCYRYRVLSKNISFFGG